MRVVRADTTPLAIELNEPFGIATGAQARADNVLFRVELEDGSVGWGEAAPFPAVNGETQAVAMATLADLEAALLGVECARFRLLAELLGPYRARSPSACCAVETAVLDALARRAGWSLWHWFGGHSQSLTSDVTIPTGDADHAARSAERAAALGYATLKVKVGQGNWQADADRLRAIVAAVPSCRVLLDGNAALDADGAVALCRSLGSRSSQLLAFEQPTAADDLEGLARVGADTGLCVIADESVRSPADVARLVKAGAAVAINIKVTKSGVLPSLDMIGAARAADLKLMIGGMVESELCMSFSACLAAGIGGFDFVDLDTPLFLRGSPLHGGFARDRQGRGPKLDLRVIEVGHGVTPRQAS